MTVAVPEALLSKFRLGRNVVRWNQSYGIGR